MPPEIRTAFLESLSPDEADALARDWNFWTRPEQRAPAGDWRLWLFMGGRGAGKTRAGAEWVLDGVRSGAMRRVALVGATYADVRDVMIAGESGLLEAGRGDGLGGAHRRGAGARLRCPGLALCARKRIWPRRAARRAPQELSSDAAAIGMP